MLDNPESGFPIVILTGLSGAGKSTALKVFEDMGFFCVDGLPAAMVPRLVYLYRGRDGTGRRGLALGVDIRQRDFFQDWQAASDELDSLHLKPQIIYFEADPSELMRRYHETRRPHPLESENMGLSQALEEENRLLEPLKKSASLVIDTTQFSIHDLRRKLQEKWQFLENEFQGFRVHILSFGFKHSAPKEADLVFDLRFLPNPYFIEEFKPLTGKDERVSKYVLESSAGKSFSKRFIDFLKYLIPMYANEGRYRLTIAVGCTGGRHRSVAVAEMLFKELKKADYMVTLEHRHMERA